LATEFSTAKQRRVAVTIDRRPRVAAHLTPGPFPLGKGSLAAERRLRKTTLRMRILASLSLFVHAGAVLFVRVVGGEA
jgi:hypothetical protein